PRPRRGRPPRRPRGPPARREHRPGGDAARARRAAGRPVRDPVRARAARAARGGATVNALVLLAVLPGGSKVFTLGVLPGEITAQTLGASGLPAAHRGRLRGPQGPG